MAKSAIHRSPSPRAGFARSDDARVGGCVIRTLPRDADLLALHRLDPLRYPHLLESAARGLASSNNRHDILFAFPGETLAPKHGFLAAFDAAFQAQQIARDDESGLADLPFRGGWFVYLGYELAGEIEPSLSLPVAAPGSLAAALPVACATRVPAAVLRDRIDGRLTLIAEDGQASLLDLMEADIAALADRPAALPVLLDGVLVEDDPARHLAAVASVRDYIFAGDVFQANLSRAWRGRLQPGRTHADLYDALRQRNPAPFAALATFGPPYFKDAAIVSSSPERLLRVRGQTIDTRPIAGTRPRGIGEAADTALSAELIAHPKERAEHIMLVDLERNDLSRVCVPGSVVVDEMMAVESYAHVHHIVSNVRGRLQPDVTPGQTIAALFPGGTITGCPKVRCMEILAELEGEARGPYTGALGYVNRDGDMDFNILIRTMLRVGDAIEFRAGGGIVADSVPERELAETRAKARGLLRALNSDD